MMPITRSNFIGLLLLMMGLACSPSQEVSKATLRGSSIEMTVYGQNLGDQEGDLRVLIINRGRTRKTVFLPRAGLSIWFSSGQETRLTDDIAISSTDFKELEPGETYEWVVNTDDLFSGFSYRRGRFIYDDKPANSLAASVGLPERSDTGRMESRMVMISRTRHHLAFYFAQ